MATKTPPPSPRDLARKGKPVPFSMPRNVLPQMLARERIELRAGNALGEHRACNRDMAFQDERETLAHFVGRLADGDGACDVGGAVFVLPAGVDQKQLAGRNLAVGRARDAVVHDGAVRARAGNGRKRYVLQQAGLAAEGFQRLDGVDLGQLQQEVELRFSVGGRNVEIQEIKAKAKDSEG